MRRDFKQWRIGVGAVRSNKRRIKMKDILFMALGIKGAWVYLAQIIIEMISAQSEVTEAPIDKDGMPAAIGGIKLQRVLDRLRDALAKVTGLGTYWPAIKAAATNAIAANKQFYTVVKDALSVARAK